MTSHAGSIYFHYRVKQIIYNWTQHAWDSFVIFNLIWVIRFHLVD